MRHFGSGSDSIRNTPPVFYTEMSFLVITSLMAHVTSRILAGRVPVQLKNTGTVQSRIEHHLQRRCFAQPADECRHYS